MNWALFRIKIFCLFSSANRQDFYNFYKYCFSKVLQVTSCTKNAMSICDPVLENPTYHAKCYFKLFTVLDW